MLNMYETAYFEKIKRFQDAEAIVPRRMSPLGSGWTMLLSVVWMTLR